jgi:hypothetical protein
MSRRLVSVLVFGLSVICCAHVHAQQKPAKVVIDVSPRWDRYDGYLHKVMNAVQNKWDRVLADSKTRPLPGTFVAVKFAMDSKGHIIRFLDVGSTSNEPGEQCCITALTMTAPLGDWTDDMVATLGISQELTARFYY